MVQEIKSITDIYLKLFEKDKEIICPFLKQDYFDLTIIEDYEENLKINKLISEQVESVFQINSFFNLPSISILAGKPKILAKIDDKINLNFYNLINYINDLELLLYESSSDLTFKYNFCVDFLFINNYLEKNNSHEYYDNILNNVKPKKFIIIEGVDNYFLDKIDFFIKKEGWKIYYLNKNKFDSIVLQKSII